MQSSEFKNLMDGKPANWAKLSEESLNELMDNKLTKREKRATIASNEEPIPVDEQEQIQKFIAFHRKIGTKESKIREQVKKKFNISVV